MHGCGPPTGCPPFDCESSTVEMHRCKKCSFQAELQVVLKRHIQEYHFVKKQSKDVEMQVTMYICEKCDYETFFLLNWLKHELKDCRKQSDCLLEVEVPESPADEKGTRLGVAVERYICDECPFVGKTRGCMTRHKISRHLDDSQIEWFQCDQCGYKGKLKSHLNQHKNRVHCKDVKWVPCSLCSYRARTVVTLNSHIIAEHSTSNYHCKRCNFQTKSRIRLNMHVKSKHSWKSKELFICDQCDYKARTTESLKIHQLKHIGGYQWIKCEDCNYVTRSRQSLQRHIKMRHLGNLVKVRWFKCDQCFYLTYLSANLDSHKTRKHLVEQMIEWHQCDKCEYRSDVRLNLNRHKSRLHGGEGQVGT